MTDKKTVTDPDKRRTRVERLKKTIVFVRRSAYILPWIVVIVLLVFNHRLKNEIRACKDTIIEYGEENERLNFEAGLMDEEKLNKLRLTSVVEEDEVERVIGERDGDSLEDCELSLEQLYDGYRKIYLTFDDGPSSNTEDILDILKKYNVKATFFVIYKEGRDNEALYRRIVDEGHTLGMHSCTHEYSVVYKDKDSFLEDTFKLRNFLYMVTGYESNFYRFPGGSSNKASSVDMKIFMKSLHDEGIEYYDWNISSKDASNPLLTKSQIVNNTISGLEGYSQAIVLMHDTASKVSTVEALSEIIEYINSMEKTVMLPITDETYPIQHVSVD